MSTSSFYSQIETNSRERISLAPGSYGTSKQAGLKIVAYIEKASKLDKSGNMRHSFLVSATRHGNGKAAAAGDHPLDAPDFEGTAFLSLTLGELWVTPEAVALAFTEASRNKAGEIQQDYEAKALEQGSVTAESLQKARIHYQKLATDKITGNPDKGIPSTNTPVELVTDAIKTQYRKELQQVSIKVGQFFQLQDWKNGGDKSKRDLQLDPATLVGVEFSGKVEKSKVGAGDQSEVTGIWSRKLMRSGSRAVGKK
jgi:hypothetical protein